ncbi:MAG: hypothetical protein KGL44_02330 [Sphingomonadales bacterium]|nr:hypothetical protein [Sphingomonadales bacterium]
MFGYTISGLRVASDLALPGLIEAAVAAQPPEVTIARGEVPEGLPGAGQDGLNWHMADGRFLLRIPGIIRMELTGGTAITYQTESGTPPQDAAIFVSGSGFGLLMHQRGRCVLHASAVAVAGKAMLFCGASGAGKSTLAAALAQAGHPLLADDQCGLSGLEAGTVTVHPDGRAMKLWRQAIDRLALEARSGAPVRGALEKFYVQPQESSGEALPLGAIYVLQEARAPDLLGGGNGIAIQRLNLADAAQQVRAHAYRPAMVKRLDQGGLYLQAAAAACARTSGVYLLRRPLAFDRMDEVIAALTGHWQEAAG